MSLPSVYFRYSLESHRPSETNMQAVSEKFLTFDRSPRKRVVRTEWSFIDVNTNPCEPESTPIYDYTIRTTPQYVLSVKVHRVFSSHGVLTASSRPLQFRQTNVQDSEGVVTPLNKTIIIGQGTMLP